MNFISSDEFLRKFYNSKESFNPESVIKRKPELVDLLNSIDPDFGIKLNDAYKKFTTYTGKGEISIIIGKDIEITFFPLKILKKMKEIDDRGIKNDIEYSISRINNKHDKRIPFVVWDSDGSTYHYEYDAIKNEIQYDPSLKDASADNSTNKEHFADKALGQFRKLLSDNDIDDNKFMDLFVNESDTKGRGFFSVVLDETITEPYKGFIMAYKVVKDINELLESSESKDEYENRKNILDILENGSFLLEITDYDGFKYRYEFPMEENQEE